MAERQEQQKHKDEIAKLVSSELLHQKPGQEQPAADPSGEKKQ